MQYIISVYLFVFLFIFLSIYLSTYLSICLSIYLSTYLPIYLSTYLPNYLSTYLPTYLSISLYLSLYLQVWKRSYPARLPPFLNLTCLTQNFCETSSTFELDNVKNEAILRDFLQNGKLSAELTASYQWVLRFFMIFPLHLCKVLRLPRKSDARSYKVLHLSRKIILAHLKIWRIWHNLTLQNATPLRKSAPWPPNTSDEHVSCTAPATRNASLQILCKCPTLAIVFGNAIKPHVLLTFDKVQNPLRLPRKTTSEPSKVVRACGAFNILTWTCALRHNGVHFFRHRNFQKCSEREMLCTFWLRNVLRARTACTFSTPQLPKVVRRWCALYVLTSKCASRTPAPQLRSLFWHLNFPKWS